VQTGASLQYAEGVQEMVHVERDKMSYPEIRGHFKDILEARIEDVQRAESCRYYWLLHGRDFSNGLMLLQDDRRCNQMEKSTMGCSVADIFVDDVSEHLQTSEQQGEGEDINEMNAYYTNPNGKKKNSTTKKKGKEKSQEDSAEDQSSDSDYMPGDNSSSEDDDEVSEINNWYKDVKKKMKTGQLEHLDDVLIDCSRVRTKDLVGDEDVSDNTSYAKNSEFDDSFDEVGSNDQIVMRPSRYRRFKETDGVPEFSLGMKFGSKQEFKEAMIQYGLATNG
jgi:alpha-galactosidase